MHISAAQTVSDTPGAPWARALQPDTADTLENSLLGGRLPGRAGCSATWLAFNTPSPTAVTIRTTPRHAQVSLGCRLSRCPEETTSDFQVSLLSIMHLSGHPSLSTCTCFKSPFTSKHDASYKGNYKEISGAILQNRERFHLPAHYPNTQGAGPGQEFNPSLACGQQGPAC